MQLFVHCEVQKACSTRDECIIDAVLNSPFQEVRMSRLAELVAELSDLLSSAAEKEQLCRCSSAPDFAATITLNRAAHFATPDGSSIKLTPGNYRADVLAEGHVLLSSSSERRSWIVEASRTWHELKVASPLALSVPVGEDEENIIVLFPGGGALLATGSHTKSPGRALGPKSLPTPVIVEAILKWMGLGFGAHELKDFPISRISLLFPFLAGTGTIEPGPSPARFAPMTTPPNWVGATVVNCFAAPLGSAGPGGPGTAPQCTFAPGDPVKRGPFAGYVTSITPVTVTSSVSMAGRVVQLLVTSVVDNVGATTMMYMTWTDVYQLLPQSNGSISFPGVIVATGRSGSNDFSTWVPDAEAAFTGSPGTGAPVGFELRVDGFTLATRSCKFNAQLYYPQSSADPTLFCQ
jgi:hypothetical protein